MNQRKKLADVLGNGLADLAKAWEATEAAGDRPALPSGIYRCKLVAGELATSRHGTACYRVTWQVTEGDHTGRWAWSHTWLTDAALPAAKRDLGRLGFAGLDELDGPAPLGIVADVRVVLRTSDDGKESNDVRSFTVVARDPDPTADPDFAGEGEGVTT